MNKQQILAVVALTAWLAYSMGQRAAAASRKPTAVATLDATTWDWLGAVGAM